MIGLSSWQKAKLYLFLIGLGLFLNGVAGQADFILTGPPQGFKIGREHSLKCQVKGDKVVAAKCLKPVTTLLLQRVNISNPASLTINNLATAAFPGCDKTWNNQDGRCESGSGDGSGEYVYEFKYTPTNFLKFNKNNVYLQCQALCLADPYPFTVLEIRPIPFDYPPPTTNKPPPLPSNDSNETTPNPEEEIGMCGEAYAGLVACVILGLINAGVVAAILKLPKTGSAAQPAGMNGELAPGASAPNTASASPASVQGKASAADVSPPPATATATTSATAATDQEDQSNNEDESEGDEV